MDRVRIESERTGLLRNAKKTKTMKTQRMDANGNVGDMVIKNKINSQPAENVVQVTFCILVLFSQSLMATERKLAFIGHVLCSTNYDKTA